MKKKNIPKTLKVDVWNHYVGEEIGKTKCMCCKTKDITQMNFHCGHVVAEANGGELCVGNLKPICAVCNLSMGVTDMNEFIKNCGYDKKKEKKHGLFCRLFGSKKSKISPK